VKSPRKKLDVPSAVVAIARRLEHNGYETWAVGGAIRDALLVGIRSDWDLATAARPEAVRKLFQPSYPIGIRFGTVGVRGGDGNMYEVTTFRRDIETDGRHAVVEYADTIDEDLSRRDFTINAIAYHPLRNEVHDPFSGQADLRDRVLRCVGDPSRRFSEDYLRVLRGLRFAGRFGLAIDEPTWEALLKTVPLLPRLSGERVREELLKVLSTQDASESLQLYRTSGALAVVYPELSALDDAAWSEILRTIDSLPTSRVGLRLAALFEPAGREVESMMTRLRFSNAEIRTVLNLARAVNVALPAPQDEMSARRWLRVVEPENARDAWRFHFARAKGRAAGAESRSELAERARTVLRILRRGDPVIIADLAIDGNDLKKLGLTPGPEYGRILERCLDIVIEDPSRNRPEVLCELARDEIGRSAGRRTR
jgi:tRNA nucleotidyltransferase (CCA-adding enzyme)